MLTSKPSTLRRFWAPVYRSVISEILGPRDPAIPQRRHFVPLKPVIIRYPEAEIVKKNYFDQILGALKWNLTPMSRL